MCTEVEQNFMLEDDKRGYAGKSHAGQTKRNVNWGELSVEITLLGLPHIVKAVSKTWPNPYVCSFQREPCWEIDLMPKMNFLFPSNSKDY